jgi:hypothetical protein
MKDEYRIELDILKGRYNWEAEAWIRYNIKMNLKERGCEDVDTGFIWLRVGTRCKLLPKL